MHTFALIYSLSFSHPMSSTRPLFRSKYFIIILLMQLLNKPIFSKYMFYYCSIYVGEFSLKQFAEGSYVHVKGMRIRGVQG